VVFGLESCHQLEPPVSLTWKFLDDVRSLSEASRRTTVEEQDEARAGALRIES
jgi:hypothetical protein